MPAVNIYRGYYYYYYYLGCIGIEHACKLLVCYESVCVRSWPYDISGLQGKT